MPLQPGPRCSRGTPRRSDIPAATPHRATDSTAGLWQYRILPQFVTRLPIPELSQGEQVLIGNLAERITELARTRYALHQRVRHRLRTDLGTPEAKLNKKMTAWWEQDFSTLRAEIDKVFTPTIPVAERDAWEARHADNRAEHARLTAEIVRLERELHIHVYTAFGLNADEVRLVEESTKYLDGAV